MDDKVAPVQMNLSEPAQRLEGDVLHPVPTDIFKKDSAAFTPHDNCIILMMPQGVETRPIAAFSLVDIAHLPEATPPAATNTSTPLTCIDGGKQLELVLNVLLDDEGNITTARTLVDTGAKVTLIVKPGVLTKTTCAATPLTLVTADGSPLKGGNIGAWVDLKIPIYVPSKKKLDPSSIVCKQQWVYEADIAGVDLIIGYPFLHAMHLVPLPSRHVLMLDRDFVHMQKRGGGHSDPLRHGPPALKAQMAPCDEFGVPLEVNMGVGYISSDWAQVQPWQPPDNSSAFAPTLSSVGMAHDDVLVGAKSVAGGFREKTRAMKRETGHLPPLSAPKALEKNKEEKMKLAWRSETYTVISQVRDHICAFAGFFPRIDAFAERGNSRCPFYWDMHMDAFKQYWGRHKLWMNPPFSRLSEVVDKVFEDKASGILIVPVWPSQVWFHLLGMIAVSWWDLPPELPIFMTRGGTVITPRRSWRTRAVVFDALDSDINEVLNRKCWNLYTDTGVQVSHVSVNSVVDAEHQAPGAGPFMEKLKDEFHDVLFHQVYAKDVDPTLRGPHGVAYIKLKEGAIPKKEVPFRMLGVREQALKAKIDKSLANGWITPCPSSAWGARAFVVPKPGGPVEEAQAIPPEAQVGGFGPWYPVLGVKPTESSDEKFWRLVIDYRYLNSQSTDDSFPLPVIEDLITGQAPNNIWSLFDLQDGFHQMHLHPDCQVLTAFVTPWGVYMWLVLPMGVKNGPAMFQRMIQTCIMELPFAKVYVDDSIVGSRGKDVEEQLTVHYEHVRKTLEAFRRFRLTLKGVKCYLFMLMIKFCGHVLCNGTRRAAPSKLKAIERWKPEMIKTVTHLKSFLGLTQFYSIYMKNYAQVVYPLTEQLGERFNKATAKKFKAAGVEDLRKVKNSMNKISWNPAMTEAFLKVKEDLLQNVVLQIANPTKPYRLRVDASDYAIGGVLSQFDSGGNERPVAFFSRKLAGKPGKGQRIWSVREKETYAIVSTLLKFRSWVASTTVTIVVETDHQSIQQWWKEDLGAMSGPVGRRGRWHEFLSGFNLNVVYVPGSENIVPDALSRWAYGAVEDPGDLTFDGSLEDHLQVQKWEDEDRKADFAAADDLLSPIKFLHPLIPPIGCANICTVPKCPMRDIHMEELWDYGADKKYGPVVDEIKNGGLQRGFWIHQGRLRHNHLTCVPEVMVPTVIQALHHVQHAGPEKMWQLFERQFQCSMPPAELKDLIKKICRQCPLCQSVKVNTGIQNKTLEFYPIPPHVFHSLAMDFVDLPHVKYEGMDFDYALVIVCRHSGYIMALPCRKKGLTAEKLATLFYHRCVWFMGLPKEVFSDQDKLIHSSFFKTLCALSGVEKYHSIAYRPQGNGRAEAAVRQVLDILKKFAWHRYHEKKEKSVTWVELLPMAVFALNDMPGVVSPYSPHRIVFGRDPIGAFEVPALSMPAVNVAAEEWFEKMKSMWTLVKEKLTTIHDKITKKFESTHKVVHFGQGDAVWVKRKERSVEHKLDANYLGPCEVLEVVRPNRYKVSTPNGIEECHGEDLKPYYPLQGKNGVPFHHYCLPDPAPEKDTYTLEKVLGHRKDKNSGRWQWKCRWKGYGPEWDTWQFAEDFVHGVQTDWIAYNKKNGINVQVKDLKVQC